jgi:hypothetical protein
MDRRSWQVILLRLGSIVLLIAHAALVGCANRRPVNEDITTVRGHHVALANQSTPTEIQAAVMSFADKYSLRAAEVFDRVHDQSESPGRRLYAREAKLDLGLGATTIACEVNPVASLLDIVALTRLKRRSFSDHWASTLPPEHARAIAAMHEQSEQDAWALAGRFLTPQQSDQLRDIVDGWYHNNPNARYTSHVRMLEFASFRRESSPYDADTPGNVLALLRIDPMARMDPVARGLRESRLLAERTMFFAARLSPLMTWQAQRMQAELLAAPDVRSVLATTEKLGASFARMPQDVEGIVTRASENAQKAVAAERDAAIRQADATVTAQREALSRDLDAREVRLRELLGEVNTSLATVKETASGVSDSAKRTVILARESSTEVIDRAFWRAALLLLLVLIGVPAAMFCYRYATSRLFDVRPPLGRPRA